MAPENRFPWSWTVPPIAVIVLTTIVGVVRYPGLPDRIPAHFDIHGTVDRTVPTTVLNAFFPVLVQVALTALLAGVAAATLRAPRNSPRNGRTVATAVLILAAFLNLTFLLVATEIWRAAGAMRPWAAALGMASTVIGVLAVLVAGVREAARGERPAVDPGHYRGVFYVNPDDPAVFVPKRIGIGWTLNFGRPASWVILGLILALLLAGAVAGALGS